MQRLLSTAQLLSPDSWLVLTITVSVFNLPQVISVPSRYVHLIFKTVYQNLWQKFVLVCCDICGDTEWSATSHLRRYRLICHILPACTLFLCPSAMIATYISIQLGVGVQHAVAGNEELAGAKHAAQPHTTISMQSESISNQSINNQQVSQLKLYTTILA